jgi:predicted RND superfamily exporter protein
MNRYIDFVLRNPRSVLIFVFLVTVLMASGVPKLTFDNTIDVMMPQKDPDYLHYEKVKDIYGNIGKFVIINISAPDIWTEAFFREADAMITDLEEFMTYDEQRERNRMAALTAITDLPAGREEFLDTFAGDQPFQRSLARSLTRVHEDATVIDKTILAGLARDQRRIIGIKKMELLERIVSPLTIKDISGSDDTLQALDIIRRDEQGKRLLPRSAGDMADFKKKITKNPAFDRALYARNPATGEITDFCVLASLANVKKKEDVISREIWDIATSFSSISVTPHGYPVVNKVMNDYMRSDLYTFLPLVLAMVALVVFLNFGTARGVALPFLTLVMADLWTLGLMGHLGKSLTIIGISLPVLLVAVGSSYSIHILNQYYIEFDAIRAAGKKKGLRASMTHISTTVFLAGLTTLLGFVSLTTNQVIGIREWGIFSALGVFFAVFIATSIIPATLELLPHARSRRKTLPFTSDGPGLVDALIARVTRLSTKHHRAVIALTLAVACLSAAGLYRLKVETAFMSFFKDDDYVRVGSRLIGEKYGGAVGMSIMIDSGRPMGIYDPAFLRAIEGFRAWLVLPENTDLSIGRVDAFTDVIKSMHMAVNNDDPAYYRIPDREVDVLDYMEIYAGDDADSDGRIDDFRHYLDRDHRTLMVFAKIWEGHREYHSTSDLSHIQKKIDRHLKKSLPAPYSHSITGEPAILIKLADYITTGQLMSLFFCLVVVAVIIVLLFKNWKAGIVAMIPMCTAVMINFGIMGWFGIRLDSATAIIASITIGIGVDDTIHFLNTYRHFRSKDCGVDETIGKVLSISGRAIMYTSLALIFGFSILSLSNFKPIILFGILSSITMAATTAGALIVLPSVIKATRLDLDENPSQSWFWRFFYIGRFFALKEEADSLPMGE